METTRQEYIKELSQIQTAVSCMGNKAEKAVQASMYALLHHDESLAAKVMQEDDILDDMIIDIEDRCFLLIAKQQPIAHDLRIITTALKISTNLERIGDHAFDIAKAAAALAQPLSLSRQELDTIKELSTCAASMVAKAMAAYDQSDVALAEKVCQADDQMDKLFARLFSVLSNLSPHNADQSRQITQLLFITRFLERIGDHATNVAEWVIYLETAERIRKVHQPHPENAE